MLASKVISYKSTFGPYEDVFNRENKAENGAPIEFPRNQPYSRDANEFVRCIRRGYAGWRRDEWAQGPLFIWGKFRAAELMIARLDEIRTAAVRVAASHGLDVVDIDLTGSTKERILRVFLEKNAEERQRLKDQRAAAEVPKRLAEGKLSMEQLSGITHEDCAAFSRDFGVLLDVEDLVPGGEYTLEASSPGLDRKLTQPKDFQRFAGCLVKVQTFEPIRNNRHWQGRLAPGDGQIVRLDLSALKQNSKSRKTGVKTVEIAIGNIEKAQLIPEL